MIDHVSVPVADLAVATNFYMEVLGNIALRQLVARDHTSGFGKAYPEIWLNVRPDMVPVPHASGAPVCLRCNSRQAVIAFHQAALAQGGAPGDRETAQTIYFGAFIFDPDSSRIETVTFPRGTTG